MPHKEAGTLIDALVSVPTLRKLMPVDTEIADPPLEPPGSRLVSQGFLLCGVVTPNANSWVWALPMMIAPASRRSRTAVASSSGMNPSMTLEPELVGMPLT